MSDSPTTTDITLLGRIYTISCRPGEEEALLRSAHYLDSALEGIKARAKTQDNEKIALMAALNITHELLDGLATLKTQKQQVDGMISRLEGALSRVDDTLSPHG